MLGYFAQAYQYQSALQDFISRSKHPGQLVGKQEFWGSCIARNLLTNTKSGFAKLQKWLFCPEKVANRYQGATEEASAPAPSTLFKVDSIRAEALNLNMKPDSCQILQQCLGNLESKFVQYRVVEPNPWEFKSSGVPASG